MLAVSLDCPFLIAPLIFSNLCPGYTRHRTKVRENQRGNQEWTIQRNCQHWVHKTQDKDKRKPKAQSRMNNPETLATGVHKTQDDDKQKQNKTQQKKTHHRKLKR
jgi:hypothetical protein